jgi:hypothetical protein
MGGFRSHVADTKAKLLHRDARALQPLEDRWRQERELLGPDGRSDVNQECPVAKASGAGPLPDAVPHDFSPPFAIDTIGARREARALR